MIAYIYIYIYLIHYNEIRCQIAVKSGVQFFWPDFPSHISKENQAITVYRPTADEVGRRGGGV